MENKMTPEAALDILTQVAYAHVANRQTHEAIAQALAIVAALVKPNVDKVNPLN